MLAANLAKSSSIAMDSGSWTKALFRQLEASESLPEDFSIIAWR
jgi:hypothetical protein